MERTISVPGHGRISVEPDVVTLRMGVNVILESAAAARETAAQTMNGVLAAITEQDVARRDVRTAMVSLSPVMDYSGDGGPKLTGYQVQNSVSVTLRQIERAGAVIDAALAAGASTLDGLEFGLDDPRPAEEQARRLAMDDARSRAAAIAASADLTLGAVINVVEGAPTPPPMPFAARAVALKAESADTPVEGGSQDIVVSLSVTFAIA